MNLHLVSLANSEEGGGTDDSRSLPVSGRDEGAVGAIGVDDRGVGAAGFVSGSSFSETSGFFSALSSLLLLRSCMLSSSVLLPP